MSKIKGCKHCKGNGYIVLNDDGLDQSKVQRCVSCNTFLTDIDAHKAYFIDKPRTITYEQWERLYKPIEENGHYKDFHPLSSLSSHQESIFNKARNENRVWTEVVTDNLFYLVPGIAYVNRIAFYVTNKPCNLNIVVEDKLSEQTLKVTEEDARNLLILLNQIDYPIDDYLEEGEFTADPTIIDSYQKVFNSLCKKYHRPVTDIIKFTW